MNNDINNLFLSPDLFLFMLAVMLIIFITRRPGNNTATHGSVDARSPVTVNFNFGVAFRPRDGSTADEAQKH